MLVSCYHSTKEIYFPVVLSAANGKILKAPQLPFW
jgi:hypothetical protein